jgi:hypothetical protein
LSIYTSNGNFYYKLRNTYNDGSSIKNTYVIIGEKNNDLSIDEPNNLYIDFNLHNTENGQKFLSLSEPKTEYSNASESDLQQKGNTNADNNNSRSVRAVWTKVKNLQFTGTTKIKNAEDVAQIMSLLENKSVEHAFAIHIDEKGNSHIQFLSIGGTTGTVVDTKISQSIWNVDRGSGEGGDFNISNAALNPSKGSVYFIDFQWLGVGRIRFGSFWRGKKIVHHEIYNAGSVDYSYMRTGTLPARIEQVNYLLAGSVSELRSYSMAVISSTN